MDNNHKVTPKKIKARCEICNHKLEPLYTMLGEIYTWRHKPNKDKQ